MTSLPFPATPPSVLLVEDDPTNQLIALAMLRHLGIEADSAANGQIGVQMASERPYDIVLMDIQMPVMDGVEAMKSIRTLLPPSTCPRIVAVTAHAVSGTRERLIAAGFDAFYNKPLSIAVLGEAVTRPEPVFVSRPASTTVDPMVRDTLLSSVRAHVRDLIGEDDEAFVSELVESFTSSSREAVREAAAARQSGDAEGVGVAAHKLKGSASNVGLDELTEVWGAVEDSVRLGDHAALAAPLDTALAQTEKALELLEG